MAPRSAGSHAPIASTRARRRGFRADVPPLSREPPGLKGRERRGRMMFMAPLKCRCIRMAMYRSVAVGQYFRAMSPATIGWMGLELNEFRSPDWRTRLFARG
jgi:hypothetical protein